MTNIVEHQFWKKWKKILKKSPINNMIHSQKELFQQYPIKLIVKNGNILGYERGVWTNDGHLTTGISVLIENNQIICHLADLSRRQYPNINYVYDYSNPLEGGYLQTQYKQTTDSNVFRVKELSCFKKNGNEYCRSKEIRDKFNSLKLVENIEMIGNVVVRHQCMDDHSEYFIYLLSSDEQLALKFGHQVLPYPLEPIDEKTYLSFYNNDYFKQLLKR